jgi:hypothetical protein
MRSDSWCGRLDLRGSVGCQDGATVSEEVCWLTWPLTDAGFRVRAVPNEEPREIEITA